MTAPAPAAVPVPRRPMTWRALALVLGVALMATLGAAALWYSSDGDLRAVAAEARRRGYPVTWADLRTPSPASDIALDERLHELSAKLRLPAHDADHRWDPPDELIEAHRALDPLLVAEALRGDALLPHGPVVRDQPGPQSGYRSGGRFLLDLLLQRFLLPQSEDPTAGAHRLLLATGRLPPGPNGMFLRINYLSRVLNAIAARLTSIPADGRPGLAASLRALQARSIDDLRHAAREDLVFRLAYFRDHAGIERMLRQHAEHPLWLECLLVRCGRAREVRRQIAWIDYLETPGPPSSLLADAQRIFPRSADLPWMQRSAAFLLEDHANRRDDVGGCVAIHLMAGLLIAELTGDAWPLDPYANGARLRAMVRDGRVIAAYSLGPDRRDDGGHDGDEVFQLAAPGHGPLAHDTAPGRGDP